MTAEHTPIQQFRDAYVEHLSEGDQEPTLEPLGDADRKSGETFVSIMKACRGVNPYISPPHASYLLQVDEFNRKRAAGDERDHAASGADQPAAE